MEILLIILLISYVISRDISRWRIQKKRSDVEYMSALINVKKYMLEQGYIEETKEIDNMINELIQQRDENTGRN